MQLNITWKFYDHTHYLYICTYLYISTFHTVFFSPGWFPTRLGLSVSVSIRLHWGGPNVVASKATRGGHCATSSVSTRYSGALAIGKLDHESWEVWDVEKKIFGIQQKWSPKWFQPLGLLYIMRYHDISHLVISLSLYRLRCVCIYIYYIYIHVVKLSQVWPKIQHHPWE
jgi:hypothetical protein